MSVTQSTDGRKTQKSINQKLIKDSNGKNINCVENYQTIFQNDPHFANVRYNTLRHAPEKFIDGKRLEWTDADDAAARAYVEKHYGIYNRQKTEDAFQTMLTERQINPVCEMISGIAWDGKPHAETFFIRWLKAEDTAYVREATRVFFAEGILRAFEPGSKCDHVLALQGIQGCGKTHLLQKLALDNDFYSTLTTIDGQRGKEQIAGVWLVEIEELSAIAKAGDDDLIKQFLTAVDDYYRLPFCRRATHNPRTCIFCATTNHQTFLTAPSGNRRWLPIKCNATPADAEYMFEREEELTEDIRQAWAETLFHYNMKTDFAKPVLSKAVAEGVKRMLSAAEIDDPRIETITAFLEGKSRTCVYDVWHEINRESYKNQPTQAESREIAEILTSKLGWKRGNSAVFDGVKRRAFYPPEAEKAPF